jgi:hypothetical protein
MGFKSLNDAYEHFKSQGGGGSFFSLKDDKDAAVVRFLHGDEDDIDWYIVHNVEINGKRRHVKCPETSDCPLCKSGDKPKLRVFLQLVDKRDSETKVWERGQNFIPTLLSFINRYGTLCGQPIEIERQGKAGDMKTQYLLYALDKDNKTLDDLPKRENLVGEDGFILDKSLEDLQQIADGTFTPTQSNQSNQSEKKEEPTKRRTSEPKSGADIF